MRRAFIILLMLWMAIYCQACTPDGGITENPPVENPGDAGNNGGGSNGENPGQPGSEEKMKLKITIGNQTVTATLYDNPTAWSFAAQLPLRDIVLRDYNRTEKIFDPPQALSKEGAPVGYDPVPGDIACYGPWGNIAIFYRDYGYGRGLIPVGRIDGNGISFFQMSGEMTVTIELQ